MEEMVSQILLHMVQMIHIPKAILLPYRVHSLFGAVITLKDGVKLRIVRKFVVSLMERIQ